MSGYYMSLPNTAVFVQPRDHFFQGTHPVYVKVLLCYFENDRLKREQEKSIFNLFTIFKKIKVNKKFQKIHKHFQVLINFLRGSLKVLNSFRSVHKKFYRVLPKRCYGALNFF